MILVIAVGQMALVVVVRASLTMREVRVLISGTAIGYGRISKMPLTIPPRGFV